MFEVFEIDDLQRKCAREVVVVGVENLELRHLERDIAGESAPEDVVGDVQVPESGEVGHLHWKPPCDVVSGDCEVDQLVEEPNLRRKSA